MVGGRGAPAKQQADCCCRPAHPSAHAHPRAHHQHQQLALGEHVKQGDDAGGVLAQLRSALHLALSGAHVSRGPLNNLEGHFTRGVHIRAEVHHRGSSPVELLDHAVTAQQGASWQRGGHDVVGAGGWAAPAHTMRCGLPAAAAPAGPGCGWRRPSDWPSRHYPAQGVVALCYPPPVDPPLVSAPIPPGAAGDCNVVVENLADYLSEQNI